MVAHTQTFISPAGIKIETIPTPGKYTPHVPTRVTFIPTALYFNYYPRPGNSHHSISTRLPGVLDVKPEFTRGMCARR